MNRLIEPLRLIVAVVVVILMIHFMTPGLGIGLLFSWLWQIWQTVHWRKRAEEAEAKLARGVPQWNPVTIRVRAPQSSQPVTVSMLDEIAY